MAGPQTTPSRRWAWIAGLAVLAAALAAGGVMALRPPLSPALQVQSAPLVRTLQFSARVATLSRVDVGATVTGRVARVLVVQGDTVRAGQPLIELESDELRATWLQARATEVQAEATLRNARAELERAQALVAQGFLSASRNDDARRAVDVALAQREAAAAAAQAAQARLGQARILAPRAARVLVRNVEPGQIVQAGRALLSLALAGPTQLVAPVDERFLEQLQVGQPAQVVADAFPGQRFAARVISLSPAVDAQRGAVEVKFALEGPPPAFLREDLTVSVEVQTGAREQALVIPLSALRGTQSVLVARDGRAELRTVQLGLRTLEAAEVVQGLAAGDLVLLGADVEAGQRVRPQARAWQPQGTAGIPRIDTPGEMGRALSSAMGR
ncbi:efflux RND transporter periplasmic adaptor subunit [Ramlibacter sp. MAHUQ-53]|uniref:efflux RND transporter periplasmic adaptor subunit n=1 Tax=unclassified Ramlibacter TaxID=2617605 RepID=UPI00363FC24F